MTHYNLHYAGSRLYSPEKFEAEAGRIGIARALPAFAIKNLAWGDTILLATFEGRKDADGKALKDSSGKPDRWGRANAWGYFVLSGLNLDAPPELREALMRALHVIRVEKFPPIKVERECGSYFIESAAYVRESLREIVERLEGVRIGLDRNGMDKPKIRLFITATGMRPLAPHMTIEPVPFTRTIVQVDLVDFSLVVTDAKAEEDGHPIAFIADRSYSARRYKKLSPEDKAASIRRQVEAANRGRRARAAARTSIANDDREMSA